jgi:hypothetical protein
VDACRVLDRDVQDTRLEIARHELDETVVERHWWADQHRSSTMSLPL